MPLIAQHDRIPVTQRIRGALKFLFSGGGSTGFGMGELWGYGGRTLAGTEYDYRSEAGLLWENGAFAAALNWLGGAWSESPMCVRRRDESGKWVPEPNHPAEGWFNEPSQYYDAPTLWNATLLSLKAGGEAFWFKERSAARLMTGVIYLPHFLVRPMADPAGTNYISYYEYRPNGRPIPIMPQDIVHLRSGLDPTRIRSGLRFMDAVLREVCTENEVATYEASLLRNMGIPGQILSPKDAVKITQIQRDELRERAEDFARDGAGKVMILPAGFELLSGTFDPQKMVVDKIRGLNAAYICAVFGLDPLVLGLPGESKTYSNYEEANRASYRRCLLPMHRSIGPQLDRQLLPEILGSNPINERIGWDYSDVLAMQEDRNELYGTLEKACGGPFLTPNEARKTAGYDEIPGQDALREKQPPQLPGADGKLTDDQAKAIKAAIAERWRAA